MAANRFTRFTPQQYISQDVGSLYPTLDRMGKITQDKYDQELGALDEAKSALELSGGYRTKQRAAQLNTENQKKLEDFANKITSGEDVQGGKYGISAFAKSMINNPEFQSIKADEAHRAEVDKLMKQPNFNQHIQGFHDVSGFAQTKKGEYFDPIWYETTAPGDRYAERKPLFDAVKPKISKYYNNPDYETTQDEYGNLHTRSITSGKEVETKTRDQVKAELSNYIIKDPNALNTQSYRYDKALNQHLGTDFTSEDELEATANAFIGEFRNEKEIQNVGRDVVTRVPKGGSGSGNGDLLKGRDNVFKTKIEEINTPKPVKQLDGTTKITTGTTSVNDKEMSAIIGGDYEKGNINTNLTGRKVYLTTPDQAQESMQLANAIDYNNKYNELHKDLEVKAGKENNRISSTRVGDLDKNQINALERIENAPRKLLNVSEHERIVEGNKIAQDSKNYNNKLIENFKTKNPKFANSDLRVDIDDNGNHFIAEDKYSKKLDIEKDPQLLAMKAEALANGIDLNDPKLQNKIKFAKTTDPAIERFAQVLENGELDGQYTLIPHKGSDNVITDKNGNLFGKNDIFMTEDQLDQIMDSTDGLDLWGLRAQGWKKLLNKKGPDGKSILRPGNIKNTNGELVQGYMLPTTVQSDESAASMTRNMQLNTYGHDDKTEIEMPSLIQQSNNEMALQKGKYQLKNVEESINSSPKNQEIIINTIDEAGKQDDTGLIKKSLIQINAIKDKKERNKEYADLYLMISNHDSWKLMHSELQEETQQSPQQQGGVQEGWISTPANPLQ